MTFERTHNYELVRSLITDPKVYPNIIDDFSPPREEYRPPEFEGVWYITVQDGYEILGVVTFVQRSSIIFDIHPVLTPRCWWTGRQKEATLGAIDWIWRNSGARVIVGYVPVLAHRTKLRFPPKLGMQESGCLPKSFLRHGQLVDQVIFSISKPE